MKNNIMVFCLTLGVFLIVFLLPVNSVTAFGGGMEREAFQVVPSIDDRYGSSPGTNRPVPTVPPQAGAEQTDNRNLQNTYALFDRTARRDGGFPVPASNTTGPVSSPSPSTPPTPSQPSMPPSVPPSDSSPPPRQSPGNPSWLTDDEAKAFGLLNELRIKNNLPPLQADYNLTRVARLKARDIIDKNYFGHLSPTYGTIGQMLRSEGIAFTRAGENLSKAGNVGQAHLQLEYSTQGHRENMLSSGYNLVGIGILTLQKTPGIIMVQLFTD